MFLLSVVWLMTEGLDEGLSCLAGDAAAECRKDEYLCDRIIPLGIMSWGDLESSEGLLNSKVKLALVQFGYLYNITIALLQMPLWQIQSVGTKNHSLVTLFIFSSAPNLEDPQSTSFKAVLAIS